MTQGCKSPNLRRKIFTTSKVRERYLQLRRRQYRLPHYSRLPCEPRPHAQEPSVLSRVGHHQLFEKLVLQAFLHIQSFTQQDLFGVGQESSSSMQIANAIAAKRRFCSTSISSPQQLRHRTGRNARRGDLAWVERAHRKRKVGFAVWRGVVIGSRVCPVESTVAESVESQSAPSSALAARTVWMRS